MGGDRPTSSTRTLALPYVGVAIVLFVFWAAMSVAVVVTFAISNRPGEQRGVPSAATTITPSATATIERPTATPIRDDRPAVVPATAVQVTLPADFGSSSAVNPASHLFFNWRCSGSVFTIATSRETIYAELPCNRYWLSDDQSRPFLGKPVRVLLTPTSFSVEATGAGVIALPATRVWIEAR